MHALRRLEEQETNVELLIQDQTIVFESQMDQVSLNFPLCGRPRISCSRWETNLGNSNHACEQAACSWRFLASKSPTLFSNLPMFGPIYVCVFFFCINESFPNLNRRGKVIRSDVPSDSRCMKVKHPNKILTKTFQKKEQKQNESLQSRSCTGRYFKFIPPSVSKFT